LPHQLKFRVPAEKLAVCRLASDSHIPVWAHAGGFFCVARTAEELSIVCDESRVPDGVRAEKDWVALKLEGPFPFSVTGVLASFIQPLAHAGIPIFAISTFDTDYVLVKSVDLERAEKALGEAGHQRLV
jgi:hypothetical protein